MIYLCPLIWKLGVEACVLLFDCAYEEEPHVRKKKEHSVHHRDTLLVQGWVLESDPLSSCCRSRCFSERGHTMPSLKLESSDLRIDYRAFVGQQPVLLCWQSGGSVRRA